MWVHIAIDKLLSKVLITQHSSLARGCTAKLPREDWGVDRQLNFIALQQAQAVRFHPYVENMGVVCVQGGA